MKCRNLSLKGSFFEVYAQGDVTELDFRTGSSPCPVFSPRGYLVLIAVILLGFAASAESLVTAGFKYTELAFAPFSR